MLIARAVRPSEGSVLAAEGKDSDMFSTSGDARKVRSGGTGGKMGADGIRDAPLWIPPC